MHIHDEYSTSDLLYLFLDGELSGAEQAVFFRSLSDNAELQAEFREALEIERALANDSENLQIASPVKNRIMAQAGLAPNSAPLVPAANAVRSSGRFKSFIVPFLSAAVGSLITIFFLYFLYGVGSSGAASSTLAVSLNPPPAQSSQTYGTEGSFTSGAQHASEARNEFTDTPTNASSLYSHHWPYVSSLARYDVNAPATRNSETAATTLRFEHIAPAEVTYAQPIAIADDTRSNVRTALQAQALRNTMQSTLQPMPEVLVNSLDNRIAFQVSGIESIHTSPLRENAADNSPWFDNIGLSARYRLDKNHAVGIAAGQETLMLFQVDHSDGNVSFDRKNRVAWLGASYAYTMDPLAIGLGIQPFAEAAFGATMFGPMGKATLGIGYQIDSRTTFSLGLEGGTFLYQNENSWYSIKKLGITYGLSIVW